MNRRNKPIFPGRRDTVFALNAYDHALGNHNLAVLGPPRLGKSALLIELAVSYLAAGAKVRVLDQGPTFEKLRQALEASPSTALAGPGMPPALPKPRRQRRARPL